MGSRIWRLSIQASRHYIRAISRAAEPARLHTHGGHVCRGRAQNRHTRQACASFRMGVKTLPIGHGRDLTCISEPRLANRRVAGTCHVHCDRQTTAIWVGASRWAGVAMAGDAWYVNSKPMASFIKAAYGGIRNIVDVSAQTGVQ
jgi:hypothetical protein